MCPGNHKILKIFVQAKLNGEKISKDMSPIDIIRKAETDKNLNKFKKDIYFCVYKTEYEGEDSIIMVFTMQLPGPITGSSASSDIIMGIVTLLEKLLMPIDNMDLNRNIEGSRKNIATLTIIKKIRETDYI
jgi:hypothetical protein